MAVFPDQTGMPPPLSLSRRIYNPTATSRESRGPGNGASSWYLLPRLLLVLDGVVIRGWGDESLLDCRACVVRFGREIVRQRSMVWSRGRSRIIHHRGCITGLLNRAVSLTERLSWVDGLNLSAPIDFLKERNIEFRN